MGLPRQPIEHEVEKKLGTEKMRELPQATVRRLCREWAEKFVDVQRNDFKRLGVNGDWEHPYLTFQPNFESANVEVFKKLYLNGAVYRGRKPFIGARIATPHSPRPKSNMPTRRRLRFT